MTATHHTRSSNRYLLLAGFLVLGLYVIVPQLGDFQSSLHILSHPDRFWTALAVTFTLLTYLAAAATYCLLAFKSLSYGQVVLVQLAAMFINRLLPGGIGALGANYAYLRRSKHTVAQAGSVVTINNLLGGFGHGLLAILLLAVFPGEAASQPKHIFAASTLIKVTVIVSLIIVVTVLAVSRKRLISIATDIRNQLFSYRKRPQNIFGALLMSMLLTLSNVICLLFCMQAMGVQLPFVVVFIIFSFGVGAGTATPTPGGLGGFEAGLVAGFVAYNVPAAAALAIALLYRLVSYWLPLAIGALAFIASQHRKLFMR